MMAYALLLAVATFIEKFYGTSIAKEIYYNPIVGIILFILIINWIAISIEKKLTVRDHIGHYFLHTAFIFIIGGAIISHYTGVEGILHLREGENTNEIYNTNRDEIHTLPFVVHLNDFELSRYPGSESPRSYKSTISIYENNVHSQIEVKMNKAASIKHYRFFQTAYDEDEAGTILTVSHDPIGSTVTHIGYILLFLGILLLPLQKKSRIHTLMKKLKVLIIFLLIPVGIQARPNWSDIQIQNPNGRIEPFDTYCRTLTKKIHHAEQIDDQDATTFILDLISRPEYWNNRPIIYQSNKEIQHRFKAQGKYLKFNDLFDADGNYLIKDEIEAIHRTDLSQRDKIQKDLLKLDEKINILLNLEQGKLLRLFPLPEDPKQRWYSPGDDLSEFSDDDSLFVSHIMPWYIGEPNQEIVDMIAVYQQKMTNCPLLSKTQIKIEHIYNRIRPFHKSSMGYLCFGFILLAIILFQIISKSKASKTKIIRLTTFIIFVFFILHTMGLAVRWYTSGQAPMSNAYESMIFAGWCTVAGSFIFIRYSPITVSLGAIFSGFILLVAGMSSMDPAITPLVPVLQSPWLMIHVAVIMCGYGFLAISFILGIIGLSLMSIPKKNMDVGRKITEITTINEISLLIGLCLMTAGTFLGAIWANEAWGRYWGWDPKETWALITILVYTVITHVRFIPVFNNDYVLNLSSALGFSSVLMTYFGVNYYLSGMHSYGSGNAPFGYYVFIIIYLAIAILATAAYLQNHKKTR